MKTIVTFLALFLTFVTYSQEEVRSFYQSEGFYSYTKTRSHLVSERNGILYFFAISEVNVNGNIELVYGPLDNSTLLPLAYFTVELPVQINQFNYLNGLNIVDNRVELIVQSRLFSLNSRFEFFTIDLDSNEILNHTSTPYDFSLGFCRARVNNGKLVLYAEKKSTSEFVRLEKSIDSTYKIEQTGFTFFSIDGIRKLSELEIVNGNEFVVFCNNQVQGTEVELLKRNSIGFYMKTQLPANSYSRKWDFFPIQNNSFLFLSSNAAIKINQDLDILETVSASFCNQEISNFSFCEGFEFNDTIYTIVDNYLEIYDQNLNMLTMHDYGRRIQNMDVLNISGNKWMIGYSLDTDKAGYPDSLQKSIVLIKNGSRKEFTEHHRALKWGKFEMMVGNYNGLFSGKDGYFNLMYESNDNLSKTGPIYASADNLLGKNVNDELVGTWQMYSYQGSKRLPGPLFTSVADSNMQRDKYNRSYYVTAQMIADHVGHILTYNNPHYGIPDGIRYWPGNGNVANGEAQKLADFVDHNNNGIYEPMLGEFPKIYGDRCLLTMYHQDQSESLNNSLEIHRYLYQYDCDTNE
ncbi:MAG TPA: hypothetical protein VKZ44_04655, partial [Taishania sp.]|nr:hypothetical protein [Taishania sp.]